MVVLPFASPPNINERCEMDLSPGMVTVPVSGPDFAEQKGFGGAAWLMGPCYGLFIKDVQVALIAGHKLVEVFDRDRSGIPEALNLVAFFFQKEGFVFLGFHAFGDDF